MAFRHLAFLLLVSVALAGCSAYAGMGGGYGGGGGGGGAIIKGTGWVSGNTAGVSISNYTFSPMSFTFPQTSGVTVTWTNNDGVTHTVTSDTSGLFNATVSPGGTFSLDTVTSSLAKGTYTYHCAIHTFMTGSFTIN